MWHFVGLNILMNLQTIKFMSMVNHTKRHISEPSMGCKHSDGLHVRKTIQQEQLFETFQYIFAELIDALEDS